MSASETGGVWGAASCARHADQRRDESARLSLWIWGYRLRHGGQLQRRRPVQGQRRRLPGIPRERSERCVVARHRGRRCPTNGDSGGQNGGVVAISCPSLGDCQASGSYLDTSGNYQAVVFGETDGVWQRGTEVTLPSGAGTVGVDGGIYAIYCASATSCVGVGSYLKGASTYEGFTLAG